MAHSNTVPFQRLPSISFKPLYTIRNFFALLAAAWAEAKDMEQKSHKISGNW
jgi:hypothetical protein